jgi:hypothetical protein
VSSHPSGLTQKKRASKPEKWKVPCMNFALIKMSLKASREGKKNFFHMQKCFELKNSELLAWRMGRTSACASVKTGTTAYGFGPERSTRKKKVFFPPLRGDESRYKYPL